MRLPLRDERGFTLVEVIVAVTIQALLIGALGMAFVAILNGTKSVNQSLARSADARLAAAYFASDAANSSGPDTSLTDTTSCPDASPPVSGTATAIVSFAWDSTSSAGADSPNIANYVLVSNSILRRRCKNGVLITDRAVASNVQTAVASCLPTANCTGDPDSIKMVVTSVADTSGSSYTYTLSGSFRKLNGAGPTAVTNPRSVILLGASTTCSSTTNTIDLQGGGRMNVYGDAYINAKDGASCKAMYLANGGSFSAGGTKILSGGSCVNNGGGGCPTVTSYTPAITDPYASYGAPSTSGMTSRTGCSGPGLYASGLNITSGTCTLTSGIYYVQNGLSVSNGASLATASGGVLIYIASGAFSIGSANSVTIAPMTTGPYAGLAVWQSAADTNTILIANGAPTVTITGALYAPKAQLEIQQGTTPKIATLVVQNIKIANGITLTVGTPSANPLMITGPMSYASTWTVNKQYPSSTLTASGGDGNYIWTVTGLPPGVTADSATGVVSGTPTSVGSYSGSVTLSDLLGDTPLTGSYTLNVNAAPNITTASLAGGDRTVAYSRTLAASGGTTPYTWTATGVPAGLSVNSSGVVSGTPTAAVGTYTISAIVTDAAGATDTQAVSLTIANTPSISTSSIAGGEKSAPYTSAAPAATGGTTGYTWSATGIPSGLSINTSTGVISGTPTAAAGTYPVTWQVTDAAGGTDTQAVSLVLAAQPTITSVTLTNKSGGTAGTIEQGDSFTIVYGSQMDVSDFCSSWTSDTTNQSLSSDNDVTVTVTNSTTDILTVTSATCTFNFGSINLGSSGYVTATSTFKGASSSKSTITWNASTHTLVVTFGAKTAGTTANVTSSTPIYTAGSGLSDTNSGTLGNSPFTLAAGKKF